MLNPNPEKIVVESEGFEVEWTKAEAATFFFYRRFFALQGDVNGTVALARRVDKTEEQGLDRCYYLFGKDGDKFKPPVLGEPCEVWFDGPDEWPTLAGSYLSLEEAVATHFPDVTWSLACEHEVLSLAAAAGFSPMETGESTKALARMVGPSVYVLINGNEQEGTDDSIPARPDSSVWVQIDRESNQEELTEYPTLGLALAAVTARYPRSPDDVLSLPSHGPDGFTGFVV